MVGKNDQAQQQSSSKDKMAHRFGIGLALDNQNHIKKIWRDNVNLISNSLYCDIVLSSDQFGISRQNYEYIEKEMIHEQL